MSISDCIMLPLTESILLVDVLVLVSEDLTAKYIDVLMSSTAN